MKKKKKGITLVEVIITLAITGIIISFIYVFFNSNNKKIIETNMKQTLQMDASDIENKINEVLIPLSEFTEIYDKNEITPVDLDAVRNNVELGKISFKTYDKASNLVDYIMEIDNNTLKLQKGTNEPIILSKYLDSFKIEFINSTTSINATKTIKLKINLKYSKGNNEVEYPIESIVTFRNKK